jgi:DNA-binding transcriptional LysR family regulator
VTIEELAKHEVMLTPTGTTYRDTLDAEFAAAGLRLRPKVEIDGLRLLTSLAYQGYAPALLPASAASGIPAGNWALVRIEGLERRSVVLTRNRRTTPSLPVQATREQLREVIRDMGPHQPGIHVTMTDDPESRPGRKP